LEGFVSWHGADHYRLPRAGSTVRLTRLAEDETTPLDEVTTVDGQTVTIFGVEAARRWRWEPLTEPEQVGG
jgi:dihydroorotase